MDEAIAQRTVGSAARVGSVLLAVPGIRHPLDGLLDAVSHSDGGAICDAIRSYGFLAPAASIALILLHMVIPPLALRAEPLPLSARLVLSGGLVAVAALVVGLVRRY